MIVPTILRKISVIVVIAGVTVLKAKMIVIGVRLTVVWLIIREDCYFWIIVWIASICIAIISNATILVMEMDMQMVILMDGFI